MATSEQQREYARVYRERHREELRERGRAKYAADIEEYRENARERSARWRALHPERSADVRTRSRQKRREIVANAKHDAGCARCGIDDPRVLDFHHVDEKTLAVSQMISKSSLQDILVEMERCTVLCANCHRIVHAEVEVPAAHLLRAS